MAPPTQHAVPAPAQLAQLAELAPQAPLARLAELTELTGTSTPSTPSTPGTAATQATAETPATPDTPEVQANDAADLLDKFSLDVTKPTTIYAVVDYGDTYVQPLILSALETKLPADSYTVLASGIAPVSPDCPTLYIQQYEELPFEELMSNSKTMLANSYVIRKALIRKHYLAVTAHNWATKYPDSALAKHVKPTVSFEVDYAEFLDDALVEAFELHESWQRNASKSDDEKKEWWILKPGMSDRGQGIRLFNSEQGLTDIFEEWEEDMPDTDDETEAFDEDGQGIMTSDLRHFVAQPYIHPPLLLERNPYKFHIRVYVLAVGALKVYVYKKMLALFAGTPYEAPMDEGGELDLTAHLTNTCLQSGERDGTVQAFWDLEDKQPNLPKNWKETVFDQITATTGELFEAAARGMGVHFQPTPNAFEVFGLDFVVDATGNSFLLEVNAFPDFKQTGREMDYVIKGLWEGVVEKAVIPFFGAGKEAENGDMAKCCDIDLGRR